MRDRAQVSRSISHQRSIPPVHPVRTHEYRMGVSVLLDATPLGT
jgi:hypothetical protein